MSQFDGRAGGRLRGWSNVSLAHARREIHDLLLAVGVPETELARRTL